MSLPQLDLVFACDCTGSMGSYIAQCQAKIKEVSQEIMAVEKCDVQYALVAYRDHPPQDSTYISKVFTFTPSVSTMKSYVDQMSAAGGGDGPEAVGQALHDVLNLPWRKESSKVCIFIADAPPHGLGNSGDGFPNGVGPDPIETTHALAALGVSVYSVAVEPNLGRYAQGRSFFKFVSDTTGGRYITLGSAHLLPQLIVGGVIEQLSMDRLLAEVEEEKRRIEAERGPGAQVTDTEWAARVHSKMVEQGVKTNHMKVDMQVEIAKEEVERYHVSSNLSEMRAKAPASAPAPQGMTHSVLGWIAPSFFGASSASPAPPGAPSASSASAEPPMGMRGNVISAPSYPSAPAPTAVPQYQAQQLHNTTDTVSFEQVNRMVQKSKSKK